ncbi:MAG: DUF4926 domain-containing protein [Anaerolineales bacterium]|nr:DUF4926 domain-containing protein [Anaerolineales bacterium]
MIQKPELYDGVELLVDLPEYGLFAGMQGTVIDIHRQDAAYEVEFANQQGEAINFVALRLEQFVVIWRARSGKWVPITDRIADLVARLPEAAGSEVLDFARFLNVQTVRNGQHKPLVTPLAS